MTRRTESGRVTKPGSSKVAAQANRYPSLRERNPTAYWIAIIGAVALIIGTFATALSAFIQ